MPCYFAANISHDISNLTDGASKKIYLHIFLKYLYFTICYSIECNSYFQVLRKELQNIKLIIKKIVKIRANKSELGLFLIYINECFPIRLKNTLINVSWVRDFGKVIFKNCQ